MRPATVLGLDLGERRVGVAIAEADGLAARPLVTLVRGRDAAADTRRLVELIAANGAERIVVGLPLEAAGQEGAQAAITRAWVEAVQPGVMAAGHDLVWTYQDERLSSHEAEQRVGPAPRGRSGGPPSRTQRDAYRARIDREAAAIILQDALDTRPTAGASQTPPPSTTESAR